MKRGRILRRRFDRGMDRLQDKIEKMAHARFVEQAREGLSRGGRSLATFPDALRENVRENAGTYITALVALVVLIAAKAIFDQGEHE